jgi:mxaL protein
MRRLARVLASGNRATAAALLLLIVAAALPPLVLPRDRYDYLVAFDVTQSMGVEDVTLGGRPATRLDLARAAAREALREMPCGSKIGWAIFADYRTMVLLAPLEVCSHYEVLLSTLDGIDGRMRWANASQIGKGVYWAARAAQAIGDGTEVVFFSDGQEAPPLRPGQIGMPALDGSAPRGVVVGVGGAVPLPIPKQDRDGRTVGIWRADEVVQQGAGSHEELSELDEAHLQAVARQTGLGYVRLGDPASLRRALLDRSHARTQAAPTDVGWVPAGLALALLAAPWLAPRRRAPKSLSATPSEPRASGPTMSHRPRTL